MWHELVTADRTRSGAFYSHLFGWTRKGQNLPEISFDRGPEGPVSHLVEEDVEVIVE